MIDRRLVSKAAHFNAEQLGIRAPGVEYLPAWCFLTPTTRAAAAANGTGIAVNEDLRWDDRDVWWAISHEMRHIWQLRCASWMLEDYTQSDGSVDRYNTQTAEIDAHAWAQIVMVNLFGVKPQLQQVIGPEISGMIDRRAAEIVAEMNGIS